jgi:hypothetical protein
LNTRLLSRVSWLVPAGFLIERIAANRAGALFVNDDHAAIHAILADEVSPFAGFASAKLHFPPAGIADSFHFVLSRISDQEDFLLNRHCDCVPFSFPQASAIVSKTRSYRNAGFRYGFFAFAS